MIRTQGSIFDHYSGITLRNSCKKSTSIVLKMSLPLIDDALLEQYDELTAIIALSGMGVASIVQLYIGALAYRKIRRNESKISRELVVLFFLCVAFCLLRAGCDTTSWIIPLTFDSLPLMAITKACAVCCYGLFYVLLLFVLVLRLHLTFKGTSFEMSQHSLYSFAIMFVVLLVLIIVGTVGLCFFYLNDHIGWILFLSAAIPGTFLYCCVCALAVLLFVSNLSVIAKMQNSSQRDVSPRAEDLSLNDKQLKLLNLAAKYILLFFVAIFVTIFTFFLIFIVSFTFGSIFVSIDLCVNLLCLYLQFAFAANDYGKCCGCLDSRCRAIVLERTKKDMHKESTSVPNMSPRSGTASENRSMSTEMGGFAEI